MFTIAHELGHHFLHEGKTDEEIYYRTQAMKINSKDKRETEANWFAARLRISKTKAGCE